MRRAACALALAGALAPARARAGDGPPAAAPAAAAAPSAGAIVLSLEEAINRAKVRSPDVVIAKATVREALAHRAGAGVIMPENPRLEIDSRPAVTGGAVIADMGYAAGLNMMFDVGGAPSARVREAHRIADVAKRGLDTTRVQARIDAWTAYLRVKIAERRLDETKALVDIAERILDASKQRATAGASGDIEESIATVDLTQLRASIDEAARLREEHVAALRGVLDLPPDEPVVLTTPLEDPPPAPDVDALVARALKKRPELAQIRARMAMLEARQDRLERETFPKMGFFAGVDAAPVSPIFGILGLVVELPVAKRNQAPRAITEAERATEAQRLELEARAIVRGVTAARRVYELRRSELRTLTESTLPAAERTLALVEAGWRAGRFDVFRLAQAARDVQRVRGRRLDVLEAAWIARIALDRAAAGGVS